MYFSEGAGNFGCDTLAAATVSSKLDCSTRLLATMALPITNFQQSSHGSWPETAVL
jgi:hypothetical protein